MKLHELPDKRLIATIRAILGLRPLIEDNRVPAGAATYILLEELRRRARPDCGTCGGFGYYDGEHLDMFCGCTGISQYSRGQGRKPGTGGNHRFVRPGLRA